MRNISINYGSSNLKPNTVTCNTTKLEVFFEKRGDFVKDPMLVVESNLTSRRQPRFVRFGL